MQERYIERKVCVWAKANGWLVRKLAWVGYNGAPDRFFVKQGRIVLIEFKQLGKKPTANQAAEIHRLRAAGVEVYVCDSIESAINVLGNDRDVTDLI